MMKAGDLKDQVVVERSTRSTLLNGDTSTVWTILMTTWTNARMISGTEQMEAGKLTSENRIELKIRYRNDVQVAVGDRVSWRGRVWIVEEGIIVDPSRTMITMTAIVDFENTQM
jgi:SPP1 family predicted phage head-tail adaptor